MRTLPETRARSAQEAGKKARKLSRYKANQACTLTWGGGNARMSAQGRAYGRRTHKPPHGTPKEKVKEEDDNPYFASVGIAAAKPSSPPLPRPRPASPSRQIPARQIPARQSPARQSPARQSPARQSPARQSPARLSPRQLRSGGGRGPAKPPTSRAQLLKEAEAEEHGQSAVPLAALNASARLLWLIRAHLAALGGSALAGRGQPTGCPATASGARASRLQSRRCHRL